MLNDIVRYVLGSESYPRTSKPAVAVETEPNQPVVTSRPGDERLMPKPTPEPRSKS